MLLVGFGNDLSGFYLTFVIFGEVPLPCGWGDFSFTWSGHFGGLTLNNDGVSFDF